MKRKALIINKSKLSNQELQYTYSFVYKEDTLIRKFKTSFSKVTIPYQVGDSILLYHEADKKFNVLKTEIYSSFQWHKDSRVH
ncbi:hypothetical protein [Mesonia aestuariivivens]|uniref:Uncharacterized protein n=1 Tax=Mesonia aestuariivivens TaxID=2796128 RepID=A0ABS6VYT5_9FLAO|nr:hypothetical protein [Mesonia aestuariivivens]MBW2960766.1 hypothetical protein [Mesonia aestuariivivens]